MAKRWAEEHPPVVKQEVEMCGCASPLHYNQQQTSDRKRKGHDAIDEEEDDDNERQKLSKPALQVDVRRCAKADAFDTKLHLGDSVPEQFDILEDLCMLRPYDYKRAEEHPDLWDVEKQVYYALA